MSLPDLKAIKKLADACRKAGIKSFKNADMEFTLAEELPEPRHRAKASKVEAPTTSNTNVDTDTLTEDQLLFYSVIESAEKQYESQ